MIKDATNTYFMLTKEEWEHYNKTHALVERLLDKLKDCTSELEYELIMQELME